MGDKSKISWTDATWNCIRGCTVVSPGCSNCYAMNTAARFSGPGMPYEGIATKTPKGHAYWTGKVAFIEKHLEDPLRWKRPRRVFVNSMSDLFHESLPNDIIDRIFDVMEQCPRHQFQVLTKRPERMKNYINERLHQRFLRDQLDIVDDSPLILPSHIWVGTSIEDQIRANERLPHLLDTPATVRFLSCEPLLGRLDLERFLRRRTRVSVSPREHGTSRQPIAWVICGGESGKGYRFADGYEDAAKSLRDQCVNAGVAFFHKQHCGLRPGQREELDGVLWQQYPEINSGVKQESHLF